MKSVIDQIKFDLKDMTYKLYISLNGNQFSLLISHVEACDIIRRAQEISNIEIDDKNKIVYYIF